MTEFTWIDGVKMKIISKELIESVTMKGKPLFYTVVIVEAA